MFPEFAKLKRITKVFVLRAEQRAAANDDEGALRDLEDARRLAVLTGQEPTLMAALSSIACEKIALNGAEHCLAVAANDGKRLRNYRSWLSGRVPMPDIKNSLRYGIYSSLVFVRNLDRLGGMRSLNPQADFDFLGGEEVALIPAEGMRRDGIPPATRAKAYMARHLLGWSELYRRTNGLHADEATIHRVWDDMDERMAKSRGLSHQLDAILFPRFEQAMRSPLGLLAARNKALALANALIAKDETGRWPTTVYEIDPFTKRPLRVRFGGKRFRVWSVGSNGTDDGGLTTNEAWNVGKRSDDLVAAYPPVAP